MWRFKLRGGSSCQAKAKGKVCKDAFVLAFNRIFLVSVSLICGGGLGNLTDRMAQGYVTDMFDFRIFPVFNVADICVCVGCGLLMLYLIIDANKSGKQNGR